MHGSMPQGSQVSWTNDSEDYQISFVPGVDRCEETKYSKNKDNPAFIKKKKSSSAYMLTKNTAGNDVKSSEVRSKPISLKDLCAEDKKRVAHLIQELANLQDEKDEIDERFEQERKEFQQQLRDLHNDKQEIIREKEAINCKYENCQDMLQEYQKNITRQQLAATEEIKLLNESVKASHKVARQSPTMKLPADENPCETTLSRRTRFLTKKKPTLSSSAELRARTMEKLDESFARLEIQHSSLFPDSLSGDDVCDSGGSMLQPRSRQPPIIELESSVRTCSGRRRQLAAQKAALEREQNQLRQLLQEQEDLLDKRQQDLQLYQLTQQVGDRSNLSSSHSIHQQPHARTSGEQVEFDQGNRSFPRCYQQQASNNNNNMSKSLNQQQQRGISTNRFIGSPRIQSTMLQSVDPLADIHVRNYSDFLRDRDRSYHKTTADNVKMSNRNLRYQTSTPHDVIHPINNSINYQNSLKGSLKGETSMRMMSSSLTREGNKLNDVSTCELPHAYYNKSDVITPPRHHHHVMNDDVTVGSDITEIVDAMELQEERVEIFSPIPKTSTKIRNFVTSEANSEDNDEDSELLEDIFFIK